MWLSLSFSFSSSNTVLFQTKLICWFLLGQDIKQNKINVFNAITSCLHRFFILFLEAVVPFCLSETFLFNNWHAHSFNPYYLNLIFWTYEWNIFVKWVFRLDFRQVSFLNLVFYTNQIITLYKREAIATVFLAGKFKNATTTTIADNTDMHRFRKGEKRTQKSQNKIFRHENKKQQA